MVSFLVCLVFFKGAKIDGTLQSRLGKLAQPGVAPSVTILKAVEARTASFHLAQLHKQGT